MSINQRCHIRFSLDVPARIITKLAERQDTVLQQISIGGCFTRWEEYIYPGDEFRIEIELPNKNRLPLRSKAIYRFEGTGIGIKFVNITRFEQELIAKIISHQMEEAGLALHVSPFAEPSKFAEGNSSMRVATPREQREGLLEDAMSGDLVEWS